MAGKEGKVKAHASLEVSSNRDHIYATHPTTFESEGEHQEHQSIDLEDDDL